MFKMNLKFWIASVALLGVFGISRGEETMTEKAQVTGNSVKRTAKKGLHRTKEAFCGKLTGDSKVECLAKEAKNHMEEGSDVVKDKATELKDKVDTDKE